MKLLPFVSVALLFCIIFAPIGAQALISSDVTVAVLQTFLESKGLLIIPPGDVKGNFGPLTRKALIEYQKSVGLPAQGIFGLMTKAKIANELSQTDSNVVSSKIDSVSNVQSSSDNTTVTHGQLDLKIQELKNYFTSQVSKLSAVSSPSPSYNYTQMALVNRIDQLTNTRITTPTIINPTVTGGSFSDLLLSNPTISGGTFSGTTLTSPSISGLTDLSLTGLLSGTNASFSGNVGVGTTTPLAKLHVNGGMRFSTENEIRFDSQSAPFAIGVSSNVYNSTRDNVFQLGYNFTGTGAKVISNEPSLRLVFESDYNNSTDRLTELNLDYSSPSGAFGTRLMGFTMNRVTNETSAALISDTIRLEHSANSQDFVMSSSTGNVTFQNSGVFTVNKTSFQNKTFDDGIHLFRTLGPAQVYNPNGNVVFSATSDSGSANIQVESANRDWAITSNSYLTDGFAIADITAGTAPIRIEPNTPSDAIYMDSTGNIGLNVVNPTAALDISRSSAIVQMRTTSATGYAEISLLNSSGGLAGAVSYGNASAGTLPNTMFVGTRIANAPLVFITGSGLNERMRITSTGNVGIGTTTPTLGPLVMASGAYVTSGGTWTNASDKNLKENFTDIDPGDILSKIRQLPISKWNYKLESATTTHIGPTAQDFFAIFGLGNNNTSISTIDPASIALVGVKALANKLDSIAMLVGGGIQKITDLVVDKLTAKKIVVDEIEIKDQDNGNIYCMRMKSGTLTYVSGGCETTIVPQAKPTTPDVLTEESTTTPEIVSDPSSQSITTPIATTTVEVIEQNNDNGTTTEEVK